MTVVRTSPETANTEAVIAGLIRAWNSGSATEFAGFFTEAADLVNIHGMHVRGRQAIAGLYQMLFRSVFADSRVHDTVAVRRKLHDHVELIHVDAKGSVPRGPMAGEQRVSITFVMTLHGNRWMVASMHNTLVGGLASAA